MQKSLKNRGLSQVWVQLGVLLLGFSAWAEAPVSVRPPYQLQVNWSMPGQAKVLKAWSVSDLKKFKKYSSREKDPQSGKLLKSEGILLSQLLDRALEELPLENRAQVDLVILNGESGERALVPRALIIKYPILLAFGSERIAPAGTPEGSHGALFSVVPWSSKPKILKEDLPLESFFISHIKSLELANYRDQYSSLFLKRRTDPAAMRGERLFVKNCVSCHFAPGGSGITGITVLNKERDLIAKDHLSKAKVSFSLSERDWKSIMRYLEAHHTEGSISVSFKELSR